jgi:hypothetical protein
MFLIVKIIKGITKVAIASKKFPVPFFLNSDKNSTKKAIITTLAKAISSGIKKDNPK